MSPFEAVLATLGIIFLVAYLCESLVEYFLGLPFENIPALAKYKWLLPYAAMIAGVVMAVVYKFDLISLLGQFFGMEIVSNMVGVVVTGMAIGRGAEYMHKLVSKFFTGPEDPSAPIVP